MAKQFPDQPLLKYARLVQLSASGESTKPQFASCKALRVLLMLVSDVPRFLSPSHQILVARPGPLLNFEIEA